MTERPVVLLNAIFASLIESTALKDIDGGNCPKLGWAAEELEEADKKMEFSKEMDWRKVIW